MLGVVDKKQNHVNDPKTRMHNLYHRCTGFIYNPPSSIHATITLGYKTIYNPHTTTSNTKKQTNNIPTYLYVKTQLYSSYNTDIVQPTHHRY